MQKRILSLIILSACCILFFVACSSVDKEKNNEKDLLKDQYVSPTPNLNKCKDYVEAGKLMIDSIVKGVYEDNYPLYSRDFTEKNKKYFNHEVFNEASVAVKDELGDIKGKEYIGFWVKGKYHILLWKAQFAKTQDDILIEMYIVKADNGQYKVAAVKLI